jgi:hypothetical protein
MPRRGRSNYQPLDRGYVHCRDNWHKEIFHVDCRVGGAQQVFEDLCRGFQRAGWDIGNRSFDNRILRRGNVTWVIGVVSSIQPRELQSTGHFSANAEKCIEQSDSPAGTVVVQLVRPAPGCDQER